MRFKKKKSKAKHSPLVQEPRFKSSDGNRSSTKHQNTISVHLDKSIVNLTSNSSEQAGLTKLLSKCNRPLKNRILPELNQKDDVSKKPIERHETINRDAQDSPSTLITHEIQMIQLDTRGSLSSKQKLPPISRSSSSSRSDHQNVSTRHSLGVCGLKNIGNTCYINSALQCLNSIPAFVEWAKQQRTSMTQRNIIDVYALLVQKMWSDRQQCVNPEELKNYVSYVAPIFSNYDQKDAHEFMNSLLNTLQAADSTSFLTNHFQIHTQSETTGKKCEHIDFTNETTTFLPLSIPELKPNDHIRLSLVDLIRDFCQEDTLDGDYYCQTCQKYQEARHKITIIQPLPSTLIIQLKRFPFDNTSRKIDTLIRFEFKYQNLLSHDDQYELSAILLHSGNLACGHYTALARNYVTKRWYQFDDIRNDKEGNIYDCIYDSNSHKLILHLSIPPVSILYEWNDFDLRYLRLIIKSLTVDSSEECNNQETSDINTAQSSSTSFMSHAAVPADVILLIFIRYLQLINVISWSSPTCISDQVYQPPKQNGKNHSIPAPCPRKKQKFEPGLCGLANIGNTCFMNSAIQCLSNIPQLTEWASKYTSSNNQTPVMTAYTSLIKSMWSGEKKCVIPSEIKQCVSQHAPIFSDYAQKDSHEFMNSLLNALQSEFEKNRSSQEQSSIVTDLFCIRTKSEVTCLKCKTPDSTEELTYCLPLPFEEESKLSLDKILKDFLKEELLDGQYYCSTCEDLGSAKQKTSICHPLPSVIIIQLKRFTFDETNEKLSTLVDYPLVDWQVDANDNSLYDLVAVSMHFGNLKRGHYTTYARLNASDQWYHFNDSSFERVIDMNCLVNRNAYVLVYLKKN
ncbi:hypothetical protein I4U23_003081 [Adineta vaga]|nr:hypothetical protein I4U23_003081 [Adineta vaga]